MIFFVLLIFLTIFVYFNLNQKLCLIQNTRYRTRMSMNKERERDYIISKTKKGKIIINYTRLLNLWEYY